MENLGNYERAASLENTLSIINRITGGKDATVQKELFDADARLRELEVRVTEPDELGFIQQFDYLKKTDGSVVLDEVWFNSDGIPVGGQTVARFVGGEWRIVKE
jgi:hypothetical protein